MKIITNARSVIWQYVLCTSIFFGGTTFLHAQNRLISGIVTGEGTPLPGVSIKVKSSTLATTTDKKGFYKIGVVPGSILIFSYLGYEPQEIIAKSDTINIALKPESAVLDTLQLTTGYYSLKERTKTGNVTRIDNQELEQQIIHSPLEALQGRVAGLEIKSFTGVRGQAPQVVLRGQSSLRGLSSSQPLYIIDGVPVNNESIPTSNLLYNITSSGLDPLAALDPALIESIEVLKDADATAIYGSRGANGVIIINTKRGRSGKTQLELQAETGVSWVGKFLDLMNTEQYLAMRQEAFNNDGVEPTISNAPDLLLWDQNKYTDWQKKLIGKNAQFQKYRASISGGNAQTAFLMSGSFQKESTIFPGDLGSQSNSLYANINHHSKDNKLQLTSSINYGYNKNHIFDAGLFMLNGIGLAPNAPDLFDNDGHINWELDEHGNPTFTNPMAGMLDPNTIKTISFQWNAVMSYELIKNLNLKVNLGLNNLNNENRQIRFKSNINPLRRSTAESSIMQRDFERRHILVEPQINYVFRKNGHRIESLVGSTFQKNKQHELLMDGRGFDSESQVGSIGVSHQSKVSRDWLKQYRYTALFGRIGYSYSSKYYLNLTGRRDGSSRFGEKNRFGNFGAIGTAWDFYKEDFIINHIPWLNYGKLRASYGTSGSDDIGDYQYLDSYSSITLQSGSLSRGGIIPSKLHNPYYQWEKNTKLEAALDIGVWEDLAFLSINWYRERSGNQLMNLSLPSITGFTSVEGNLKAMVQNTGWEFAVKTSPIHTKEFSWKSIVNLAIPKNKLIDFPDLKSSPYANQYVIGEPLGILKLYDFTGVDPDTGVYSFEDVNGDGVINSEDKIIIKDLSRKYYGGWMNTIDYKNWHLSFLFEFVKQKGGSYFEEYNIPGGQPGTLTNIPKELLDRWQHPGDKASYQKYMQGFDMGVFLFRQSNKTIEDASFIRMKSISLNYRIPEIVSQKLFLQSAQIYLNAQNLFTLTPYKGYDAQNPGGFEIPALTSVHIGLKLTL